MKRVFVIFFISLMSAPVFGGVVTGNKAFQKALVVGVDVAMVKPLMLVGATIGLTSWLVAQPAGLLGQKDLDEQGIERFTDPLKEFVSMPGSED